MKFVVKPIQLFTTNTLDVKKGAHIFLKEVRTFRADPSVPQNRQRQLVPKISQEIPVLL